MDRLRAIDREIAEWQASLAECEIRLEGLMRIRAKLAEAFSVVPDPPFIAIARDVERRQSVRVPKSSSRRPFEVAGSIADQIRRTSREVLLAEGRPMNRYELVERLRKAGVSLDMANPDKRVGKILWGSEAFVNVARRGYWLSDVPVPEEPQ